MDKIRVGLLVFWLTVTVVDVLTTRVVVAVANTITVSITVCDRDVSVDNTSNHQGMAYVLRPPYALA